MSFIDWSKELSVGYEQIDTEHKKLIELVNRLHGAMSKGQGNKIMGEIFDELLNYTVFHFQAEEKLMKSHSYPQAPAHFKEHQDLIQQVLELQAKFKAGTVMLSIATMDFLKNWLANHILQTDMNLGHFLAKV